MHISSMDGAFSLTGKTAIVTGGNRGIGLGISEALAHHGASVAILCRNEESAKEAVAGLSEKYDGKFAFYKTDIRDFESCRTAVDSVLADFGAIDILVNNAGVGIVGGLLDMDESLESWFECFDVDLHGAVRMSYLVGKHMRERGSGRVINISSNSGEMVNRPLHLTPYNCAKAALNRLTKCLAVEWGEYGIRVNAIAPGYTAPGLTDLMPKEACDELIAKMPIGRFGQAIEIGALAVYLASPASDAMTGAVLTVDGGYSLAI